MSSTPLRAVIFDFGDVLVRSGAGRIHREWERRLGLPPGTLAQYVFALAASRTAALGQIDLDTLWRSIGDQFHLSAEDTAHLRQDFLTGDELDPAMVGFARSLRPRYKTAVLSNAWPESRAVFVTQFGLDALVDLIVISSEEGLLKPDPTIYRLVAERLGLAPDECLLIDDSLANVSGARDTGMLAILHEGDVARTIRAARAVLAHSGR